MHAHTAATPHVNSTSVPACLISAATHQVAPTSGGIPPIPASTPTCESGAEPPLPGCAPTPRFTTDHLIEYLKLIENSLNRWFKSCAVEAGLDVALFAGLRLIRRVEKGEAGDPDNPKAYLWTVASNAARRYWRRNLSMIPLDITLLGLKARKAVDAELVDSMEEFSPVMAAVDELPRRQREVLVLRVLGDLRSADAARELGVSRQSADRSLRVACARLKEKLGGHKKNAKRAAGAPLDGVDHAD